MNVKATTGLLGCLFVLAQGRAVVAGVSGEDSNPYAVISERNVFHLNPIPPPPAAEAPKVDLPKIKLSGFLRIGKTTHALFSCTPKDKKDGPIYYNLADGEKSGILEVVKIHEDKGEVEIVNTGKALTLNLKNDSLEPTAPAPNKGAPTNSDLARRIRTPGGPVSLPDRAAYRFPVPGAAGGGGGGPPGIPLPARRSAITLQ